MPSRSRGRCRRASNGLETTTSGEPKETGTMSISSILQALPGTSSSTKSPITSCLKPTPFLTPSSSHADKAPKRLAFHVIFSPGPSPNERHGSQKKSSQNTCPLKSCPETCCAAPNSTSNTPCVLLKKNSSSETHSSKKQEKPFCS